MKRMVICTLMMHCMSQACIAEPDSVISAEHQSTPTAGGSFQSIHGQRAYNDASFFITQLLKNELKAQEDAAVQAYLHKPPEVAVWALEELIRSYARNGLIMRDINAGWEQETKSNRMFAHARLYKLYTSMNDEQQAQKHLDDAVQISDGKSADTIVMLVDHLDRIQAD